MDSDRLLSPPAGRAGSTGAFVNAGAVYFFYYMALGAFLPFINLYYRGLGLTGVQIGVLAALPALAASPAALAWGVLADVLHVHRGLFRAALLLTPLAGVAL